MHSCSIAKLQGVKRKSVLQQFLSLNIAEAWFRGLTESESLLRRAACSCVRNKHLPRQLDHVAEMTN